MPSRPCCSLLLLLMCLLEWPQVADAWRIAQHDEGFLVSRHVLDVMAEQFLEMSYTDTDAVRRLAMTITAVGAADFAAYALPLLRLAWRLQLKPDATPFLAAGNLLCGEGKVHLALQALRIATRLRPVASNAFEFGLHNRQHFCSPVPLLSPIESVSKR